MKMHVYLLFAVSAFMAMAAAQTHCDPQSQYEKDGMCCNMCSPGNRMLAQSTCQDPVCDNCEENEYMDKYTNSFKCNIQPYCDPNKNFQVAIHKSKVKTHVCVCKEGFYCSSRDCITCVQHTKCEPGFGVHIKGDHTQDTVCKRCLDGTFSDESSSDGVCLKWTECKFGYEVGSAGTETSDTTCAVTIRGHIIVIIIGGIIALILLGAGIVNCIYKKKSGYMEIRAKVYACMGCQETERITQAEQGTLAEQDMLAERSIPVENEDEEGSLDHGVTENGNVLTQEYGKMEILSRQESQTQESCSV